MARAGTTTPFWWGSSISTAQANYDGIGQAERGTVPVGSFEANPWGLFNVHGNVLEWCADVWHEDYNGAPTDGSPWLLGGNASSRVARRGSWDINNLGLRSAFRLGGKAVVRFNDRGFRLARTLNPNP